MPTTDSTLAPAVVTSGQQPDTALAIWSQEERDIIRSVIAPGLSDAELRFFAQVCRATGLNPLMNQIHAIKRNAWNPATRQQEPKMTIQTSIHGLRLIADRTRCYAPGRPTVFEYGEPGRDGKPALISATAYVMKLVGGTWHEFGETAYWDEYVQTGRDGEPVALWKTKPRVMLAKCSESLGLRRGWPAEMAGVYTEEEYPAPAPRVEPLTGEVIEDEPRQVRPAERAQRPVQQAPPPPAPALPTGGRLGAKALGQWLARARAQFPQPGVVEQIARDLTGVPPEQMTIVQAREVMEAVEGGLLALDGDGRYVLAWPVWDDEPAEDGDERRNEA